MRAQRQCGLHPHPLAERAPYEWEFERDGEAMQVDVPWSLSLDNHGLIARTAPAGAGLGYVAEAETADHVASGRLGTALTPGCRRPG